MFNLYGVIMAFIMTSLMSLSSLVLLAVEQWPLIIGGHMRPAVNDCRWNFWSHQMPSVNNWKISWEGMMWHCRWGINDDKRVTEE